MNITVLIRISRYLSLVVLPLLLFAVGCGKPYERVNYNQPHIGPIRELVFTTTGFGATDLKGETFVTPLAPEEPLAFTGNVDAPKPMRPRAALRMTKQHGSKTVLYRSAQVLLAEGDDQNSFKFRGEVRAPKKPGTYVVTIKVNDALIAHGQVTVKQPP